MKRAMLPGLGFALILCATPLLAAPALPSDSSADLDFEARVRAQRAIEHVYHSHRIDAPEEFEAAVPTAALEAKVRRFLRQSHALEQQWSTPVTARMLDRELERMIRDSRDLERLQELFTALNHDPILIRECLVRPILVDRQLRNFFTFDTRIHVEARFDAEELHEALLDQRIDPGRDNAYRSVQELSVREQLDTSDSRESDELDPTKLDRASFERWRSYAPADVGNLGDLVERQDRFELRVLLAEGTDWARVAVYSVPKQSAEQWWSRFEALPVGTVADPDSGIPARATSRDCSTGSWRSGFLAPDASSGHTAVWTGSEMIVWGGEPFGGSNKKYDPATDLWNDISAVGAPPRGTGHTAVWTGTEMIVWGGTTIEGLLMPGGGRYDAASDSWSEVSTLGAPSLRYDHTVVWTGTEMIVWGGYAAGVLLAEGGRYDPTSGTWSSVTSVGEPATRHLHTAVWTGDEMIVWGGFNIAGYLRNGGRYDADSDTWSLVATMGAPEERTGHTAVWTGTEMIVWGGFKEPHTLLFSGGRYDPATDSWTPTSTAVEGRPVRRYDHTAIWTGTEMIVWGGAGSGDFHDDGGRYDPVTDTWALLDSTNTPDERAGHSAVWTGDRMIVWGGHIYYDGEFTYLDSGGRYEDASDTWTPTSQGAQELARYGHTAVWTGNEMIVWGGASWDPSLLRNDGTIYTPATDTSTPTGMTGVPTIRRDHTAVWTGTEMFIWGGYGALCEGCSHRKLSSGSRYDLATDSWTPMSSIPFVFNGRTQHTAVWTGSEMIVWGGNGGYAYDNGARYFPLSDAWLEVSIQGDPSPRHSHSAVWTGTEMIIWGGRGNVPLDTGGRYNPTHDEWWDTSTAAGLPQRRYQHTAVWTGTEMVVWGGLYYGATHSTGGRYDPLADTWVATNSEDAPAGRTDHSAVWTGTKMIVWGGHHEVDDYVYQKLDSGGFYEPWSDSWEPTALHNAPLPRANHVAVWTGDEMIVWSGGSDASLDARPGWIDTGILRVTDFDGDGFCGEDDCDDSNEFCNVDCTDLDADGYCVTHDCDEANPNCTSDCTDGDTDGYCITTDCDDGDAGCTGLDCSNADDDALRVCEGDCDDLNPNCSTDCTDADLDGYCTTTDCDETNPYCTSDCTDADVDGFCVTEDCDDTIQECTLTCIDSDGDGMAVCAGDCDDSNSNCSSDCTDFDGDGYCVTTDCDDSNAYCTADCTDADSDGVCAASDCDDSVANCTLDCTDADGDGLAACAGDCDDFNAFCSTDCTDSDSDGYCVTTDCDETNPNCTADCTDGDSDGFCVTTDCDDASAACTGLDCSDADSDGVRVCENDCDDLNPNCTLDCTDADDDSFCVTEDCDDTRPFCTADCTDNDGDDYCIFDDCLDFNPNCTTDCTDADGDDYCVTTDCDETNPNCTDDCTDTDTDGFCVTLDCDDVNANCTTDCTDADGDEFCVTMDCDDTAPGCTGLDCNDQDGDGVRVCENDCDDLNAQCTSDCTDADGDLYCVTTDCDDSNTNCSSDCTDVDGDSYCVTIDCDDSIASCTLDCIDADSDGVWACADDCDDLNPYCTSDCTDLDVDGYCTTTDCDETNPNCTSDCTDADTDLYCVTTDCDDTNSGCNTNCMDGDGDGLAECQGDCDDDNPNVHPDIAEVCTDNADNDCNELVDAADANCIDLVTGGLAFTASTTLAWTDAMAADSYGLYRGTIPETGMTRYDHLCQATELTTATAVDPDEPDPRRGFYYLVAGQETDLTADRFTGGPLGTTSNGASRPTSDSITCGPRVYVDPDVVGEANDGLSWATAYSAVSLALNHGSYRDRGAEVWVRGTVNETGVQLPVVARPGVRLLGGFAGTETGVWERSPESTPTIWNGNGGFMLFQASGTSVVLDGLTLRAAQSGFVGTPAGRLTKISNVTMEQIAVRGVDLLLQSTGESKLVVHDSSFDSAGLDGIRVVTNAGLLSGEIRNNEFTNWTETALKLEARPLSPAEICLDIVSNVISGGGDGILLGAHVNDSPATAMQSSFVASNLIHGTAGNPLTVEATGYFDFHDGPALVDASPLIVGNTLVDAGGDGIACISDPDDLTVASELHTVRATPQIWNNLITHNLGAGISETADDPGTNLVADPVVVRDGLHGNTPLYRDEGVLDLTLIADVNALDEARDNFDEDPLYRNRAGQDYHLAFGTVVGFKSGMRYLANATDPGLDLLWTQPGFDATTWKTGIYGVGFDTGPSPNAIALLPTKVPPVTVSVYTLASFTVDDLGGINNLILGADYDDGFAVWINGVEVFRSATVPGGTLGWTTVVGEHESSNAATPVYEEYDISTTGLPALLQGQNTLAVAIWNAIPSDDLVLVPRLILQQESPAVDQADLDAPRLPTEDVEGDRREGDGDRDGIARPDVGADERW